MTPEEILNSNIEMVQKMGHLLCNEGSCWWRLLGRLYELRLSKPLYGWSSTDDSFHPLWSYIRRYKYEVLSNEEYQALLEAHKQEPTETVNDDNS